LFWAAPGALARTFLMRRSFKDRANRTTRDHAGWPGAAGPHHHAGGTVFAAAVGWGSKLCGSGGTWTRCFLPSPRPCDGHEFHTPACRHRHRPAALVATTTIAPEAIFLPPLTVLETRRIWTTALAIRSRAPDHAVCRPDVHHRVVTRILHRHPAAAGHHGASMWPSALLGQRRLLGISLLLTCWLISLMVGSGSEQEARFSGGIGKGLDRGPSVQLATASKRPAGCPLAQARWATSCPHGNGRHSQQGAHFEAGAAGLCRGSRRATERVLGLGVDDLA